MSDIVVIGHRYSYQNYGFWSYSIDESSGYEPFPTLSNDPGGGDPPPSETIFTSYVQCSSADSTAKAASDKIKSISQSYESEFTATIVAAGGGQFQLYKNSLFTEYLNDESGIHIPNPPSDAVKILLHTHPQDIANPSYDNANRYPSPGDWQKTEGLVAEYPQLSGLTIGIQGPDGAVRLFPFSDRATFKSLSDSQMASGADLPTPIPSATGCSGI